MRPDCKALGQITSCINYCRVPVADGARCVFDSCDLYSANPVSNAGVCAENSTCVLRAGETDPRAGVCVARAQHLGCDPAVVRLSQQCPYGAYCLANTCPGPSNSPPVEASLLGGLAGQCTRYRRAGESCNMGTLDTAAPCPSLCEPGATCYPTLTELPPPPPPPDHPDVPPTNPIEYDIQYQCARTCARGGDGECDCPSQDPLVRSRCYENYQLPNLPQFDGFASQPVCVRPSECRAPGEACAVDAECCHRGDRCVAGHCVACAGLGTSAANASQCCSRTFFSPDPEPSTAGTCVMCAGEGQTASGSSQCCPPLNWSPVLGTCTTCSGPGVASTSLAACCPTNWRDAAGVCQACGAAGVWTAGPGQCCAGLVRSPLTGKCEPCRGVGEQLIAGSACCETLIPRTVASTEPTEEPVYYCGRPCATSCMPPAIPPEDTTTPRVGRCALGVPTGTNVCNLDGTFPQFTCMRLGPIAETCLTEDENCLGGGFDVDTSVFPYNNLGRAAATVSEAASALPPGGFCPMPNEWDSGGTFPMTNLLPEARRCHYVCDGTTEAPRCVMIPGLDFASRSDCRLASAPGAPLSYRVRAANGSVTTHDNVAAWTWGVSPEPLVTLLRADGAPETVATMLTYKLCADQAGVAEEFCPPTLRRAGGCPSSSMGLCASECAPGTETWCVPGRPRAVSCFLTDTRGGAPWSNEADRALYFCRP